MAGVILGTLPFVIGDSNTELAPWKLGAIVVSSITLISTVSAVGSLALARRTERLSLPRSS